MRNSICPKCGSREIMANVEVQDRTPSGPYPLRVYILEPDPPDRGFFYMPKWSYGEMRAWICAACGFTETYTNNLAELYKSYRQGQS